MAGSVEQRLFSECKGCPMWPNGICTEVRCETRRLRAENKKERPPKTAEKSQG